MTVPAATASSLGWHVIWQGTTFHRYASTTAAWAGDSEGDTHDFEEIADDLRSAVDMLFDEVAGLRGVVLWGLCDGASAAALYAWQDGRVAGIALLNPWVQDTQAYAHALLRHNCIGRLANPQFWRSLVQGEVNPLQSFASVARTVIAASRRRAPDEAVTAAMKVRDLKELKMTLTERFDLWARQYEQQGIEKGDVLLLRRQLMRRFGVLPEWAEQRLKQATTAQL